MDLPRLLLAEDQENLRNNYTYELTRVGFMVSSVIDGLEFYELLNKEKFNLIVSDTDLPFISGDEVCKKALELNILEEDVLIIAMSEEKDNQQYWRGIVNHCCFYNKANLTEGRIGERVLQCWNNFKSGGLWKEKMPPLIE